VAPASAGVAEAYFTLSPGRVRTRPHCEWGRWRRAEFTPNGEKPAAIRVMGSSGQNGFGPELKPSDPSGFGCYWEPTRDALFGGKPPPKGSGSQPETRKGGGRRGEWVRSGKVGQNLLLQADGKPGRLTGKREGNLRGKRQDP
jgi:hypothetical protein